LRITVWDEAQVLLQAGVATWFHDHKRCPICTKDSFDSRAWEGAEGVDTHGANAEDVPLALPKTTNESAARHREIARYAGADAISSSLDLIHGPKRMTY
jgi:hypothetical protein